MEMTVAVGGERKKEEVGGRGKMTWMCYVFRK